METRVCPLCKEEKALEHFYDDDHARRCKECVRADINKRYNKRREYHVVEGGIEYLGGARYIGPTEKGKRHGKGKYIFADGWVEHGIWHNDILIVER